MNNVTQKKYRRTLLTILFTIFVDLLGFGILIPIIPLLVADPQSQFFILKPEYTLSQSYIIFGFLSAMWSLMVFLVAPIFGQLSDKVGRKKILIFALIGTALSYLLFAIGIITKNLPLLFFSRAFDGITGSSIAVAQAAIADVTDPKNRAKNFGIIGAAFGLGFIMGPYLGGKLSDPLVSHWFNATTPFFFAAALSFLNVLFIIFFFQETLREKNCDSKLIFTKAFSNIFKAWHLGPIRNILLTNFLLQGGFAFFTTFFAVFLIRRFSFNQSDIGNFFSYIGFWGIIAQVVVLRIIIKKFDERKILQFSLIAVSFLLFAQLWPNKTWQLLLITPFFSVANGLCQSTIPSLVSRSATNNVQGEILGINSSVQNLAMAVPPMISGYIAAAFAPEAAIFVSSIVIFVAWVVFVLGPRTSCASNDYWQTP